MSLIQKLFPFPWFPGFFHCSYRRIISKLPSARAYFLRHNIAIFFYSPQYCDVEWLLHCPLYSLLKQLFLVKSLTFFFFIFFVCRRGGPPVVPRLQAGLPDGHRRRGHLQGGLRQDLPPRRRLPVRPPRLPLHRQVSPRPSTDRSRLSFREYDGIPQFSSGDLFSSVDW